MRELVSDLAVTQESGLPRGGSSPPLSTNTAAPVVDGLDRERLRIALSSSGFAYTQLDLTNVIAAYRAAPAKEGE